MFVSLKKNENALAVIVLQLYTILIMLNSKITWFRPQIEQLHFCFEHENECM